MFVWAEPTSHGYLAAEIVYLWVFESLELGPLEGCAVGQVACLLRSGGYAQDRVADSRVKAYRLTISR